MLASLASRPLAAFPVSSAGRLPRYPFRGLLNVHCALSPARSLNRPRRPFSIEVLQSVSLPPRTAPIATGWSDSCRTGSAPAEKQRLSTAHGEPGLIKVGAGRGNPAISAEPFRALPWRSNQRIVPGRSAVRTACAQRLLLLVAAPLPISDFELLEPEVQEQRLQEVRNLEARDFREILYRRFSPCWAGTRESQLVERVASHQSTIA